MIFGVIKTGVSLLASAGIGDIVGNAISATTPKNVKTISKVCIGVGSLVLTCALGDMAGKYVEERVDSIAKMFKKKDETDPDEEISQEVETPEEEA